MKYFLDKTASLTPMAYQIICHAATEHPFSGAYQIPVKSGSYLCRRCGLALFRANSQFSSGCGWPSFDENILNTVEEKLDADGRRNEIHCRRCEAHLGHVFKGEQFTPNNKRHCVNALSLDFVEDNTVIDTEEIIVAGGCFWGVEHHLKEIPGVLYTAVGYTGGGVQNPTYTEICHGRTGHYEAVRVIFDNEKTTFLTLARRFFEIHDPTQAFGQGPDIGHQYQSAVFCYNQQQTRDTTQVIHELELNHYDVKTHLLPVKPFWLAEEYHQQYYTKQNKEPYCHQPVDRFNIKNKRENP
jgi:peptide methionine sulfoxide reductase msrA/msrB